MLTIIKYIFGALVLLTLVGLGASAQQAGPVVNQLPPIGVLRGVASHTGETTTFVAAWYWVGPGPAESGYSILVVFELADGRYVELFRLRGSDSDFWEQLRSLPGSLTGFVIETSDSITDHDGDTVVALVGGKFATVFKGSTSEVVDLNADGLPEILESSWPDGDGYPETARVHVFDGKKYVAAGDVPWRERFSPRATKLADRKNVPRAQPN